MLPTIVLDNGGGMLKFGIVSPAAETSQNKLPTCRIMPNCITKSKNERRRPFIAGQIEECRDTSGLYFLLPFQKGYLCAPDTQKTIWDYIFSPELIEMNTSEMNLLITEPVINFKSAQEILYEILFEEYDFNAIAKVSAPALADYKYTREHNYETVGSIIIDSGYSFTHIVPFLNGKKLVECTKRIDVGGKVLTNYLKEVISYRQLQVLDETYIMNEVKEELCFVSTDFKKDMRMTESKFPANKIYREYILPDYTNIKKGYTRSFDDIKKPVQPEIQLLRLNNERFSVPEALFNPELIGIRQMGISEALINIINSFDESIRPHFSSNIIITGGNAFFKGFKERITKDLKKNSSVFTPLEVSMSKNPQTYAWSGGVELALDPSINELLITKENYLEHGLSKNLPQI